MVQIFSKNVRLVAVVQFHQKFKASVGSSIFFFKFNSNADGSFFFKYRRFSSVGFFLKNLRVVRVVRNFFIQNNES